MSMFKEIQFPFLPLNMSSNVSYVISLLLSCLQLAGELRILQLYIENCTTNELKKLQTLHRGPKNTYVQTG